MSKMGISTIASYRCSKLFEAVGLHDDVVGSVLPGAWSAASAARALTDFQQDLPTWLLNGAWLARKPISQGGLLKYVHGGEYHAYNPDVVRTLQQAVQSGEYSDYQEYAKLVNERPAATLRDSAGDYTWRMNAGQALAEVEPATELFKRFDTAAMSIGALSPEAHEALAEAMNSIGGNSNSGEGGEDPARYGTNKVSRIKQVASGRFGVTPAYLVNADVIQIKVAQGAKPGEGGQLPGDKAHSVHRQTALFGAGRDADLPTATPRYLLYRGLSAADFRPEAGQPESDDLREAGFRTGRRHYCDWRGESLCGSDYHCRLRRRYRGKPTLLGKIRGLPVGAGAGGNSAGAGG